MSAGIFDFISSSVSISEDALNKKTVQIRLFFPHHAELSTNTLKFLDRILIDGSTNTIRKPKGITVFGRVKVEDVELLHTAYGRFKYDEGINKIIIQRFILYFPSHHFLHLYFFSNKLIRPMTEELIKTYWGVEPELIKQCNIKMLDDVFRYSCIVLFNRNADISKVKLQVKNMKGKKHPVRTYFSEYTTQDVRETRKQNSSSTRTTTTTPPQSTTQQINTNTTTTPSASDDLAANVPITTNLSPDFISFSSTNDPNQTNRTTTISSSTNTNSNSPTTKQSPTPASAKKKAAASRK